MPVTRLGRSALRGSFGLDDSPRRSTAAADLDRLFRATVGRRVLRDTRGSLPERVALLDMLGLLPADWPREGVGRTDCRPLVVCSEAAWSAAIGVDGAAWFRDTLVPCSGQLFREKWAQHVQQNAGRKRPPGD